MRRSLRVWTLAVLLMGIAATLPAPDRCSGQQTDVNCGMRCLVWGGNYSGFCSPPAPDTAGCVQLVSGCGSVQYVECCDPNAGQGQF